MKKNFKIFDVVLFDGNQDLLNLRFSEFYNIVDFFILIPSSDNVKYEINPVLVASKYDQFPVEAFIKSFV